MNFSMLIKPASSLCNMRCKYCFYSDVSSHRDIITHGIMNQEITNALVTRVFEYVKKTAVISFAFQGGEPTLAGVTYFEYFIKRVGELNTENLTIHYSIQTNGMLIDDKYCQLFKKHKFLVGISQDGPRECHDCNRLGSHLEGTYDRVNKAIKLLEQYQVDYNIVSVITKQMAKKPQTLFRYYEKKKYAYVQLIPCLKSLDFTPGDSLHKYDLTSHEYAQFLKAFFTLWYDAIKQNNYISVRQFDNLVLMLKGQAAEQCGLMGRCNLQCVVEADGSVYPCDFYVLDEFKQGNLFTHTIADILKAPAANAFLTCEVPKHPFCMDCKVYSICGGGCKRYRSFYSEDKSYCPYQDFLYTSYERLVEIARNVSCF